MAVPPPPPAGAQALRTSEPPRAPMAPPPPPPASMHAQEPRSPEVARSQAPTIQSPVVFPSEPSASASPVLMTPPEPMPALREASLPPVPDETLPPHSTAEPSGALRGTPARAAQPEPGGASPRGTEPLLQLSAEDMVAPTDMKDMSRRGLDDTHPGYAVASGKPPEDTQPRVVLEDPSLRGAQEEEEQIIVSGVLEESPPARGKPGRRTRAAANGMPSVARAPAGPGKSSARPSESEDAAPESSAGDDSLPLLIDIEDGGEAPRDPREETRKTPLPARPGESPRRAPKEEARRAAAPAPAAPARKRSWPWALVSLLLLGVAGGAVYKTLPQLKHLMNFGQGEVNKPPPPVPIRPVPVPSGPPGAPRPAPAAVAPPGATPPAEAATTPAGAATAAAPSTPEKAPGAKPEAPTDDGLFVPLPTPPSSTTKKSTSSKSAKKNARASKELTELQRDWKQTRELYGRFTQEQACEASRIAIFCSRYNDLKQQMQAVGDEYNKELHGQVKKLKKDFQQRSP